MPYFRGSSFLDPKSAKIYDDNILIGNWFENRAVATKDSTEQKQKPKLSEYEEMYAKPFQKGECTRIFTAGYVQAFRNRARSHHSSVKLFNAEQFMTNLTSSNDLFYRIKPGRNRCGKMIRPPTATINFDPLKSYGNTTTFGLRRYIAEREERLKNIPLDMSFTRDFYKCPRKGDYAKRVRNVKK